MSEKIQKWVCGKTVGGDGFVLRSLMVYETQFLFKVGRSAEEISEFQKDKQLYNLLGWRTQVNRRDRLLFDTADEAVKNSIAESEREVNSLSEKLNKLEAELTQLETLLT